MIALYFPTMDNKANWDYRLTFPKHKDWDESKSAYGY